MKEDYDRNGWPIDFVDIEDESVGHIHNVVDPRGASSEIVNEAMMSFFRKHALN